MPLGLYLSTRVSPKSLRNRGKAPLLLMGTPGISISIIGDEWAKKNAGIFSGEEGRSSSAFSHVSLVFGAVAVMGMVGSVWEGVHKAARRRGERMGLGFKHRRPNPEKRWAMNYPVQ